MADNTVVRHVFDREKAWTLYRQGFCDQEIADKCGGVSLATVSTWRVKMGMEKNSADSRDVKKKVGKSHLVEYAAAAQAAGMSYGEYMVELAKNKQE